MRWGYLLAVQTLMLGGLATCPTLAQSVSVWETSKDATRRLQPLPDLKFREGQLSGLRVTVDLSKRFQSVDGFGYTLTQGSAEAISQLSSQKQNELLRELFDQVKGIGISMLRVSIGASDLSRSTYSYDDHPGDVSLKHFSFDGPDAEFVFPLLKRILKINPKIKLMGTPWSAPRWMKTNNKWIGGKLRKDHYETYAKYLVRYLQEMNSLGMPIWAITPQNEPENDHNDPSMVMNAHEQLRFVDKHLGPAIRAAGLKVKIIAFDHNCDHPEYAIKVLSSKFASGAAFHLYAGDISAMSTVKSATGKNVYFTEQWTASDGDFGGDLGWHMRNVMTGSLNNWSKAVLEWNLANDRSFGPHTEGGCSKCKGAITVLDKNRFERNVSYYIIAHASKFIRPGAVRIHSSSADSVIKQVAFQNPDRSIAMVVFNDSDSHQEVRVVTSNKSVVCPINAGSVLSLTWEITSSR